MVFWNSSVTQLKSQKLQQPLTNSLQVRQSSVTLANLMQRDCLVLAMTINFVLCIFSHPYCCGIMPILMDFHTIVAWQTSLRIANMVQCICSNGHC